MIDYHLGKANVVADALSRKSMQTIRALNAHFSMSNDGIVMTELIARPSLLSQVLKAQNKDEKIAVIVSQIGNGKEIEFTVNEDGVLYYKDRVCVPNDNDLRKSILEEAHSVTPQNPGGPLTTCQPTENLCVSYHKTHT